MKYDGIVLFSDLDGTLLDDERRLIPENLEGIRYFVENGGRFGVATGRMGRTAYIKFSELPINTPSIFFNGALVYDHGSEKELYKALLPEDFGSVFGFILDNYPECGIEINTTNDAFIIKDNSIIREQLLREGINGVEKELSRVEKGWIKVLFADSHGKLEEIKEYLLSLGRSDVNIMFSEKRLLDIMARGVSKGNALLHVQKAYEGQWRMVFAVGDNDNDADMLKIADVGIAVENATPMAKEAADYIISHHNTPCIPQILRIIDKYL